MQQDGTKAVLVVGAALITTIVGIFALDLYIGSRQLWQLTGLDRLIAGDADTGDKLAYGAALPTFRIDMERTQGINAFMFVSSVVEVRNRDDEAVLKQRMPQIRDRINGRMATLPASFFKEANALSRTRGLLKRYVGEVIGAERVKAVRIQNFALGQTNPN